MKRRQAASADITAVQRAWSAVPAILILLVLMLSSQPALADKSYRMKDVSITADLASDGSMSVSEARTYRFKGRFKYAFRTFRLDERISYADFRVSENGQPYELADSKEPGTYRVTQDDGEIEVRWYYRARNEARTFTLDYRVDGAVKRHDDTAVLYYKFVGDDFRKTTRNLSITVNPPAPISQFDVRQWAHGPLWAGSATADGGIVTATCENLPRKRFFELRILYPEELFAAAPLTPGYVVGDILAEEEAWAEAANRKREKMRADAAALKERQKIGIWALPLLVGLAAWWFFLIARKYGRRPEVPAVPTSSGEIPGDLPPAMVAYLLNSRTVTPPALMATLMDLAGRGFLEFREEHELGKGFLGKEKWTTRHLWVLDRQHHAAQAHSLAPHEAMVIEFVFEDLPQEPSTDPDRVVVDQESFKQKKSEVRKFFQAWSKEVKQAAEAHDFFDQDSFKGRNQGMWLGAGLMALALAMVPLFHAQALIPGLAGLVLLLGALGIVHPTRDGMIQMRRWKGLRSYLKGGGYESAPRQSVLDLMGPYFVYGVVLGLEKKHLDHLGGLIPANQAGVVMPWYHTGHGPDGSPAASFGASFSTAVASVNSAMSSSTGAGGGASGGGGGGAGGGGGGAG